LEIEDFDFIKIITIFIYIYILINKEKMSSLMNFDSESDCSLDSNQVEYDMLVTECQELLEEFESLRNENS
jgi:hypothetical protein